MRRANRASLGSRSKTSAWGASSTDSSRVWANTGQGLAETKPRLQEVHHLLVALGRGDGQLHLAAGHQIETPGPVPW